MSIRLLSDHERAFVSMWGLVHVVHFLSHGSGIDPTRLILLASGLAVFLFPGRWYLVAALAAVHLLTVLDAQLLIPNHSMIMFFGNVILLVGLGARLTLSDLLPVFRTLVLIAYGAAAVAKLNHGFFNPVDSCTTEFYGYLQQFVAQSLDVNLPAPLWLLRLLPILIASAELAVPILLLIPRFRHAGVGLLVPLHLSMSLNPLATGGSFTALVFCLAFLFLSRVAQTEFVALVSRVSKGVHGMPGWRAVVLVVMLAATWWASGARGLPVEMPDIPRGALTALITVVLGALLLTSILRTSWIQKPLDWRIPYPLLPVIVLLVVNAISPYMGGRNVSTFTMFSNLQTELGVSNHFLIPRLSVWTGQDDLVRVVESSNPALYNYELNGYLINWHELRRHTATFPDDYVVYERGGNTFMHSAINPQPELGTTHPFWHYVLHYRPYSPGRSACMW